MRHEEIFYDDDDFAYAEEIIREEQQEYGTVNTPYDDAFRTLLVDLHAFGDPGD